MFTIYVNISCILHYSKHVDIGVVFLFCFVLIFFRFQLLLQILIVNQYCLFDNSPLLHSPFSYFHLPCFISSLTSFFWCVSLRLFFSLFDSFPRPFPFSLSSPLSISILFFLILSVSLALIPVFYRLFFTFFFLLCQLTTFHASPVPPVLFPVPLFFLPPLLSLSLISFLFSSLSSPSFLFPHLSLSFPSLHFFLPLLIIHILLHFCFLLHLFFFLSFPFFFSPSSLIFPSGLS